jgi:hypothetical protein
MFGTPEGVPLLSYIPSKPPISCLYRSPPERARSSFLGPWNITKRLEQKLGTRLVVDAVIEVDPPRAEAALGLKKDSPAKGAYEGTRIMRDVEEFGEKVRSGVMEEPRWVESIPVIVLTYRALAEPSLSLPLPYSAAVSHPLVISRSSSIVCSRTPVSSSKSLLLQGRHGKTRWDDAKAVGKILETQHKGTVSVG